jgi:hypothetical protein
MPIPTSVLLGHIKSLHMSLMWMRNPPAPRVVDLFNRLLAEGQAVEHASPLVHEIPALGPDTHVRELGLWLKQLEAALRRGAV